LNNIKKISPNIPTSDFNEKRIAYWIEVDRFPSRIECPQIKEYESIGKIEIKENTTKKTKSGPPLSEIQDIVFAIR